MINIFKKKENNNLSKNIDEKIIEESPKEEVIKETKDDNSNNDIKKLEHDWIEIYGYKATDSNMVCMYRKYEMNKTIKFINGNIYTCEKGFHLCKNLEDVFSFYKLNGENRFFKVRAVIDKNQHEFDLDFAERQRNNNFFNFSDVYHAPPNDGQKNVAKEIEFLEEISEDELYKYFEKIYKDKFNKLYPYFLEFINRDTFDKMRSRKKDLLKTILEEALIKLNINPILSMVLSDKINNNQYSFYLMVKSLKEIDISNDMLIYLILREADKREYNLSK